MNQISAWAIRKPIPTIVLFLLLTIFGILAFTELRINNTPDIELPTVIVSVQRTGAAPTEMETQITRIVEDAVAGISNVKHIRSTINESLSTTNVEFAIGTNIDRASENVRNAVTSIRSRLPSDVMEPTVQRVEATGQPILTYVVDAPHLAPDELSWFVDNDIAKAVLAVNGVSKITRAGGVDGEVRVQIDPDRLMALGITAAEVSKSLKSQNVNQPGGRSTMGGAEQSIRTLGSVKDTAALAQTRISLNDGRSVRLGDLGIVTESWAEPRQRARFNNREVIAFSVYRSVDSGETAVADRVGKKLEEFKKIHPRIAITEVTSSTAWVTESYHAAIEALWLGAALAIIVVWIFLRDARATLISSVAVPLSLLPTFAVLHLLNQSLNNITLLAIALVVGVLVDDAIVEIENIVRHMRSAGKSAYEAAIDAADEIGMAVVATTFSIVAVFVPVGFMGGIPGQFFKSFAIAVCCSVFFSLVVARMLTPLMSAFLMKSAGKEHDELVWIPAYLRILRITLRHPYMTVVAGIAVFVASVGIAIFVPSDFMPASDRGRSILTIELSPGSTLTDTDAVTRKVVDVLLTRPEVASVYAAMGTQTSSGPGGSNTSSGEVRKSTVTINLKPKGERQLSQQKFEALVGPELARVSGARLRFGGDGASGSKIQVALLSDDPAALDRALRNLSAEMRGISGLQNVGSTAALARPELLIAPKLEKAAELGISTETIASTVNIATLGDVDQNLPKFNLGDRQISIRVMLREDARADLSLIANLQVPASGGTLPLSSIADIALGSGPNQIDRLDRRRTSTVEGELVGITIGQAEQAVSALAAMRNLPSGVTRQSAGDTERLQELTSGFAYAIGSGVVLLYFVLVLLFQSFVQPVTIMTALPLSLGGALIALLLSGSSLSMSALIGILMLMGIAAKNSILLVEYAIVARKEGTVRRGDALVDAARKRARPIIMTTVAMGAGMLPIALGIGADAEFRAPMAIAVIGGLLSSTILSLVYVPAVYVLLDDFECWIAARLRWLVSGHESKSIPH